MEAETAANDACLRVCELMLRSTRCCAVGIALRGTMPSFVRNVGVCSRRWGETAQVGVGQVRGTASGLTVITHSMHIT